LNLGHWHCSPPKVGSLSYVQSSITDAICQVVLGSVLILYDIVTFQVLSEDVALWRRRRH